MIAQQLHVVATNQPDALAEISAVLGAAGINIEVIAAFDLGGTGKSEVDLIVSDVDGARRALETAHFVIEDQYEVVVTELGDAPGSLATLLNAMTEAAVPVQFVHGSASNRLVIGTELVQEAEQVAASGSSS